MRRLVAFCKQNQRERKGERERKIGVGRRKEERERHLAATLPVPPSCPVLEAWVYPAPAAVVGAQVILEN